MFFFSTNTIAMSHVGHFGVSLAITERDLSRVRRVQGYEEAGHTELGHAQSRLQDDRKLRLRDGAVLLRLKHLDDGAKDVTL